ncbi:procathepsin L-like [Tubulanus polymorphus]|uniref:procathepsin L-like n=1 Tax=Tubulanus polymorphus TaxID=672921 RepID=UPI003DA4129E
MIRLAILTLAVFSSVESIAQVDWRAEGAVTEVMNQGQCGSSWAFAATGALEGFFFRKTGKLVKLSEQNVVDCTKSFGNNGCRGGWPGNALKYVRSNTGIDTESSYPYYKRELGYCYYRREYNGASSGVSGISYIPTGDENALKAAVKIGPVAASIDASHPSFSTYRKGIYYESRCGNGLKHLTQSVLIVGYGNESGADYWLIKNSYGTFWGLEGYMKIARNRNNQCGIATKAFIVI